MPVSAKPTNALVTGAGGFIAHHLCKYLVAQGYHVRGVDIKEPEYGASAAQEFELLDLRKLDNCLIAARGVDEIYHLAADMGGIGYITQFLAEIAKNNTMMNVHLLEAARIHGVKRFLFSSTACVYPQHLQKVPDIAPLREDQAYPADPEEGYGWEKLYMEKLCEYYMKDYGIQTRVVRFHNVYGPLGTYEGGKEKVPAAVCRKVALATEGEAIEVWGDGEQTRSFMHVDDCVIGIDKVMHCDDGHPFNLGRDEMVTINELYDIVAGIAGKRIEKRHDLTKPQGVRGRNSDNSRLQSVLGWQPPTGLTEGLAPTYAWISGQLAARRLVPVAV